MVFSFLLVAVTGLSGVVEASADAGDLAPVMGSFSACDVPLAWRVGEIDPRFAVGRQEVEEAIRTASHLWEDAVGRRLFTWDPDAGFPVHLVFDHRQALAVARYQGAEALEGVLARLERWRGDLGVQRIDLDQRRSDFEGRIRSLDRQVASHNRLVQSWNEQGGAPPEEAERLAAIGERFQVERQALNRLAEELNRESTGLARETEALNDAIRDYNRSLAEFQAGTRPEPVQAGTYREEVRTRDGLVVAVEREIRVFQFSGLDHLVLILAHELGHALGLEHSNVRGSVMYPQTVLEATVRATPALHPTDTEALRRLCGFR
jgi:hypothetical protein